MSIVLRVKSISIGERERSFRELNSIVCNSSLDAVVRESKREAK